MPNIEHWKQANSNISFPQQGDEIVIGARSGIPTRHRYDDVRMALTGRSGNYVGLFEDFLGYNAAQPANWKKTGGSTGTALTDGAAGVAGGLVKLLTAATSSDYLTLALGTHWSATNGPLFYETYLQLDQLTATKFEAGLSDALSETAGLAFSDHTVATVTDVATDAITFVYDVTVSPNWLINTVKDGTSQAYNTGVVATTSLIRFSTVINTAGDATFLVADTEIVTIEDAITPTVAIGPWFSIVATAAALKSARVDYVSIIGAR